jgi:hypothetical protein
VLGAGTTSQILEMNGSQQEAWVTTLPTAAMPAMTGDVTNSAGSLSTTVSKIQGTTVSGVTGTGNVVMSASPAFSGTPSFPLGSTNFVQMNNAGTTLGANILILQNDSASGDASAPLAIIKHNTTNTTSQVFQLFQINAGGTLSGTVTAAGASNAQFSAASDRRLKKNIRDLEPELENILALRPVRFEYKNKAKRGSGEQVGFIAQEVQKIFPEHVAKGDDGYLQLTGFSRTDAKLVKAIQELNEKFEAYKASHP